VREMTVLEAARKYQMHPVHLTHLLRLGAYGHPGGIQGRKDANGRWLVTDESVQAHRKKHSARCGGHT
jgi:hypothetical protein